MDEACAHLKQIHDVKHPKLRQCDECVPIGARWVHLRTCQQCGTTLCCDSSPNKHANKHFEETGHPVMRSFEPGEAWRWCFVDEQVG